MIGGIRYELVEYYLELQQLMGRTPKEELEADIELLMQADAVWDSLTPGEMSYAERRLWGADLGMRVEIDSFGR